MNKEMLVKIGGIAGLIAAVGVKVYLEVQKSKRQEVIDITPNNAEV